MKSTQVRAAPRRSGPALFFFHPTISDEGRIVDPGFQLLQIFHKYFCLGVRVNFILGTLVPLTCGAVLDSR